MKCLKLFEMIHKTAFFEIQAVELRLKTDCSVHETIEKMHIFHRSIGFDVRNRNDANKIK